MSALLEVRDLSVRFRSPGGKRDGVTAVDAVTLTLGDGEWPGLVGESGCGKTTLGRAILGLVPLAGGEVRWLGRRIDALGRRAFRPLRRELQLVFQDPHACLDPRMPIAASVAEPLRALVPGLSPAGRREKALVLLGEFGLDAGLADRYPHQLSGGQLQRAVIARALIVEPRFVVLDEPTSALDVSVQGQIVNLLARLRATRGLAGLFISHNLAVVAGLCERILVMYRGRIVESAPRARLLAAPLHPYSRRLLDSVPALRKLASPEAPPAVPEPHGATWNACAYAARCPFVVARCRSERPPLVAAGDGREVACHRAAEWPRGLSGLTR